MNSFLMVYLKLPKKILEILWNLLIVSVLGTLKARRTLSLDSTICTSTHTLTHSLSGQFEIATAANCDFLYRFFADFLLFPQEKNLPLLSLS
ncbi:hypothetical protein FGO68_gene14851 [Halteria grandinella]|uniref:Uncharacterized protein n=1 Tax=Halteria grandinella TaxID=5974 RepID=A0A8J8STZ3_HALGN|nr:hypothetical protein FGO68_gene14851 [Halteria grandinella]